MPEKVKKKRDASTQTVKQRSVGMRLDQFLKLAIPQASRTDIQRLIRSGGVSVDGLVFCHADAKVRLKSRVTWTCEPDTRPVSVESSEKKEWPTIRVIFEDNEVLAIAKPAGISMHPVTPKQTGTLAEWLSTHYPQLLSVGENPLRPGMVHRLDKETSGVVVLAKHNKAFFALKQAFQKRLVQKEYLALVYGRMKAPSGVIDAPIGRIKGSVRRSIPQGERVFSGALREAVTEYGLHTRYPQYDLLVVKPRTGRTHQIRVHLASLGHPIVGDRLYRFKEHRQDPLFPPHQLLHAQSLRFSLFGKPYRFEAPLPGYFTDMVALLRLSQGSQESRDKVGS